MISDVPQPSAVARMISARQTCFLNALRSDPNRLKPTAIVRRDLDRNSRSHHESLNCFGRFEPALLRGPQSRSQKLIIKLIKQPMHINL